MVLEVYDFSSAWSVARKGFVVAVFVLGDRGIYTTVVIKDDLTLLSGMPLILTSRHLVLMKYDVVVLNNVC